MTRSMTSSVLSSHLPDILVQDYYQTPQVVSICQISGVRPGIAYSADLLSSKAIIATLSTIERLRQTSEWTPVEEPRCHRSGDRYGLLTSASGVMLFSFASIPHRYTIMQRPLG